MWLAIQRGKGGGCIFCCTGRDRRAVRAMLDGGVQPPPQRPHSGDRRDVRGCTVAVWPQPWKPCRWPVDPNRGRKWKVVALWSMVALDGGRRPGLKPPGQPTPLIRPSTYDPKRLIPPFCRQPGEPGVDCLPLSDNQVSRPSSGGSEQGLPP